MTLSGSDLTGTFSVIFDGVEGAINDVTPTSVTVTTPAQLAGTVDVVVSTPGGSSTLPDAYTFVDE